MSSAARSAREEERRINVRTLVIASAASAAAAVITSQFWIAGTPYAAAITPVIVALVSELLNRPAEKLAGRFTIESDALPEAAGAGPPPRSEAVAPDPAPDQPPLQRAGSPAVRARRPSTLSAGDAAPVRVYRQPSAAGVRARRALPWRTILVTAGLAFVIAAVVLTIPELIAGQSLGRGDGGTSILGNDRNRSNDAQEQAPATPDPQQSQPPTTQPDQPQEQPSPKRPPAEEEPPATTPGGGGTGTTPRTTTTPAAPR